MQEVRRIPTAPRRVRVGAMLAHRWPLLAGGALLCLSGGLICWMLFLAAGAMPSDQRRLDREPTVVVTARVTAFDSPYRGPDGSEYERVHYDFVHAGATHHGSSIARAHQFRADQEVPIELLVSEPNRNRIAGTVLLHERSWLRPERWLGTTVIPGALLLLGWLTGVFRLRRVLVDGDVSSGEVKAVEPVRWLLPETLRVRYRFRDHSSTLRQGAHWVRQRSNLGRRLLHQQHTGWFEPLPVLFDRQLPQHNRMMLAADFAPPTPKSRSVEQPR